MFNIQTQILTTINTNIMTPKTSPNLIISIYFVINLLIILALSSPIASFVYTRYSYEVANKLISSPAFWVIVDSVLLALIFNISMILLVIVKPPNTTEMQLNSLQKMVK
jgi:hypothetical protein